MSGYLEQIDIIKLQKLNSDFYDNIVPRILTKISQPSAAVVLESSRTNIELGFWKRDQRNLQTRRLFKIGDGTNGTVKAEDLGFAEVYFQYVIQAGPRVFYCWPMENEAMLKVGHRVEFDINFQLKESTPLPPLADQTMRPTAVLWTKKGEKQIMMLGGQKDRWSQNLNLKTNTWTPAPAVPAGHNITTNIAVNWKDKAIFTFIIDAQLTIKSAVMDLEKVTDVEDKSDMAWALVQKQESHKIDRLHLKCGVTLPDGRIAVLARGKPEGCLQQISGVVLYFQPELTEDGTYKITLQQDGIQRHFPALFPRQLDHL
jgi:hypothetical protein